MTTQVMSVRDADLENDLFRVAFDDACKDDKPADAREELLAWDFFKYGWEAAVRCLNDDATTPAELRKFAILMAGLDPHPDVSAAELVESIRKDAEDALRTTDAASASAEKRAPYLTDAELADEEFMRAYVEGCNDSFAEVLAENVKLRAELAASTRTASDTRTAALEEAAMACEGWGKAKVAKWVHFGRDAKARAWDALQCAAAIRALSRATTSAAAESDCDCGCNDPVATDAFGMIEFLAYRFEHAGVSELVAKKYARDCRAILAAQASAAGEAGCDAARRAGGAK